MKMDFSEKGSPVALVKKVFSHCLILCKMGLEIMFDVVRYKTLEVQVC